MNDPVGESRSIRRTAAQTRAESMKAQLALAISFCNVAETEIALGDVAQAALLLENARKVAENVGRHIQEHGHLLSPDILVDFEKQREVIESRVVDLKQKLTL